MSCEADRRPKVAVVGLNHGYALARALKACDAVELVGLCTRSPERHRAQADELERPLFARLDTLLGELEVDGVVIAGPTHELVSLSKSCLERNISVLVEKPLAVGVSEALELKEAAAGKTARVVVGYYRRLARQVVELKRLLASGVIGKIRGFSCKWVIQKPPGYFKGWKASRALGGGCLMINAVHELDLLQQVLGPIESVAAMGADAGGADDVEHLVAVTLRLSGGEVGTALFCDQSPSPYSYDNTVAAVSKFPRAAGVDSHHFFGTRGSLAFPSFTVHSSGSPVVSWYDALESAVVSDANEAIDDPIARQIERFAQVLRGENEPHASIDDAVRNLAVVEAIRRSLEHSTVEQVRL